MSRPQDELRELTTALRHHLLWEKGKGRDSLVHPGLKQVMNRAAVAPSPAPQAPAPRSRSQAVAAPPTSRAREEDRGKRLPLIPIEPETPDYADRMEKLARLGREAAICELCGLCKTRTQVVFSRGRARTRVLFIGEAPGADEDRLGEPFVGRAGKLLDRIIDAAGFQRDEVYVANILKCRPPGNRDPGEDEITACTPYLEQQIELVDPKIICALGRFAAQFLTGNLKTPMARLRGKIHYYRDRYMVLPTYHPAALLRNPGHKRVVWEDIQLLRKEYLR